jgi:WD40 repeat protein
MKKTSTVVFLVLVLMITSCTPETIDTPSVFTEVPNPAVTSTSTTSIKESPTALPTRLPTNTPYPPMPDVTPIYIGTPVTQSEEPISADNLERLAQVAQWGRGDISSVRFTPDGKSFVVGSDLGLTVYELGNLQAPPAWIPFESPILYQEMYFNDNGQYLILVNAKTSEKIEFKTGLSANPKDVTWLRPQVSKNNYSNLLVLSWDRSKKFQSIFSYEFNEEIFSEEVVTRKVLDESGKLLYEMPDDIPYVTYRDRVEPEGCDLGVFSPCGNALMALAMAPKQVEFSPLGDTFAVLYTVPSLWSSSSYNFLRVYDAEDGSFVMSMGGQEHPISSFAYTADSRSIGLAYLDGSVQIWDIGAFQARFGARHMNALINSVSYTSDSQYLLIQRRDELEIRRTSDGSMIGRFDAITYAVSPTENLVAIGDQGGMVRIRRIDNGENLLVFQAHEDLIYSIAFSKDGLYLATGGRDCDVKMWDAKTGKLLHYFEETRIDAYDLGSNSRIFAYHMEFIPNTDTVVGFGSWGTAVAWNINSGATKYVIQSAPLDYYNGMWTIKPHFPEFFGVDLAGNRFFINESGYDIDTGELTEQNEPLTAPKDCFAIGPKSLDEKLTFTLGYESREGQICVLNTDTRELIRTIPVEKTPSNYFVEWLYISPDGKQLLVTTVSGVSYIYQIIP